MSLTQTRSSVRFIQSQRFAFLVLFLALALIPLAVIGVLTDVLATQALTDTVENDLQSSTAAQRDRISAWLQKVEGDVRLLSRTDSILSMDPQAATQTLVTFADVFPLLESTFLADLSGQVIASDVEGALGIDVSDRQYYLTALQGQGNFSDALVSRQSGNIVVFRAEPVYQGDTVVGVVAVAIPTTELATMLQDSWAGETGDAYLVNPEGLLLTAPRFPDTLKELGLFEQRPELEVKLETEGVQRVLTGEEGVSQYADYRGRTVTGAYFVVNETQWGLIREEDTSEILASVTQLRNMTLALAGGIAVLVTVLALWFSSSLSRPVLWIAEDAERLAAGEALNTERMDRIARRKDELGLAGRAFQALTAYLTDMGAAATRIAQGDLSVGVDARSAQDRLGNAFSQMVVVLREQITTVSDNAVQVADAAGKLAAAAGQAGQATNQIGTAMQQVASGTQQQTMAVNQTASSVEQMRHAINAVMSGGQEQSAAVHQAARLTDQISGAVQTMAHRAQAGADGSTRAAQTARSGAQTVTDTIQSMHEIKARVTRSADKVKEMGERSNQVGTIVEAIDDIASQTNLLALNAAIEAARAGEHGKGFAVVADEVRKLAEKSAGATKEIAELIRGIQSSAREAVSAMEGSVTEVESGGIRAKLSGEALAEILSAVETVRLGSEEAAAAAQQAQIGVTDLTRAMEAVNRVVEKNAEAMRKMEMDSGQVTNAIENIAAVSEENSAAVEEVSASAEEMSAQVEEVGASARSLNDMAGNLQQVVRQFRVQRQGGAPIDGVAPEVTVTLPVTTEVRTVGRTARTQTPMPGR